MIRDANGEVLATFKVAVWTDSESIYHQFLVELHDGRTLQKHDELEVFVSERVRDGKYQTTGLRLH
eukprot:CAMPEP_0170473774 /NCGR_PEP_ID=MMETSP0123-20130129/15624_1 /TAXON_ID=182087 /ORGANISM="Favella ehrenbergii, Strain Fehren 1" /LENGTH=65 /DNA_ID=CAMNT_0010743019 /DNA_START=939 /DNA_END=1136 /DNA_ORIENTATION=-